MTTGNVIHRPVCIACSLLWVGLLSGCSGMLSGQSPQDAAVAGDRVAPGGDATSATPDAAAADDGAAADAHPDGSPVDLAGDGPAADQGPAGDGPLADLPPSVDADGAGDGALADTAVVLRDKLAQPFAESAIWNLPIGANASYVPGQIPVASGRAMTVDKDVLILKPAAPLTAIHYNADGWSGGSRCSTAGQVLRSAPIPASFVVPGATATSKPNHATAILLADGHTLAQNQPFARCVAGQDATTKFTPPDVDIYGDGRRGAHGGSGLSSIGGTIRLGEWIPGGQIPHALKINLFANVALSVTQQGYRWPAYRADSYYKDRYGGSVPELRMGSLLALPPSINVEDPSWLKTEAARILARALQNYGGYVVDDTAWDVWAVATELSPDGDVLDEFNSKWGFPLNEKSPTTPFGSDMVTIFTALHVVDNWDAAAYAVVAASNGAQGAGSGTPRVPWAAAIGN